VVAKEKNQAVPEVVPAFHPLQQYHLDPANCSLWLQPLICDWKGPPDSSGTGAFSVKKKKRHKNFTLNIQNEFPKIKKCYILISDGFLLVLVWYELGFISQKTAFFIVTGMKTSHLT
jgi:hypothetical protein